MSIEDRLERIERLLHLFLHQSEARSWYSVEEFAHAVGRSPFTCRQWCRLGRITAQKKASGRGAHLGWVISHDELLRYRRDGLLPERQKK